MIEKNGLQFFLKTITTRKYICRDMMIICTPYGAKFNSSYLVELLNYDKQALYTDLKQVVAACHVNCNKIDVALTRNLRPCL